MKIINIKVHIRHRTEYVFILMTKH